MADRPLFPVEILIQIWERCCYLPRTVELRYGWPYMRSRSPAPCPVVLHICYDSRAIALKHYELAFCVDPDMEDEEGNLVFKPHRRPDIYFNFAVDTMALTWHQTKRAGVVGSRGHSAVDVFVHKLDRRELDRVQHLAMDEDLFQYLWDRFFWRREDRHPSVYFEVFRAFFNLRTFTIVWVVGPREYFWHGEPKFDTTFIRLEENARPVGHAGHRDLCSLLRGIETTYSSSFHVWHRPELRYAVKSCVT